MDQTVADGINAAVMLSFPVINIFNIKALNRDNDFRGQSLVSIVWIPITNLTGFVYYAFQVNSPISAAVMIVNFLLNVYILTRVCGILRKRKGDGNA